jgi:hypothetical protein
VTRPLVRTSECRSCHEPIAFVRLIGGKVIPVNPLPGEDGNVIAELVGSRLSGWVESAAHPWQPGLLRFRAHFATCTERQARAARKPKPPPDPELDLFNQPTEETP